MRAGDFYLMFASYILQNVTTGMESGFLTIVDHYTRGLAVNSGFLRVGPADYPSAQILHMKNLGGSQKPVRCQSLRPLSS